MFGYVWCITPNLTINQGQCHILPKTSAFMEAVELVEENPWTPMLPKHLRLLQGEFVGILLVTDAGGLLPFQAVQVRNFLVLADWFVGWLFSDLAWVFVQVVAVR